MTRIFQQLNQYLLLLALAVVVLYFGKPILIPVTFAALLAMLMAPICRFLDARGFHRSLSCLACLLIILSSVVGVFFLVGGQISSFEKDLPKIKERGAQLISQGQSYIEDRMGVEREEQKKIAKEQAKNASQSGAGVITRFFSGVTTTVASFVLTLVYMFLMLYNKERFQKFFLMLYKGKDREKVEGVVDKIATVSQKYLTGRVMSICIIAFLYSVGLTIVGIKNAILLACLAALLTVVPFIGTTLGGLIPVAMALATEESMRPALMAALVLFVIQTIDNYFIEPNVVGGEVSLAALTSIMAVICGGLIWGVAGMILFLPLAGIVKIVCDNVESLKPIGFILGEPEQKPSKIKLWILEKLGKRKPAK